MEIVDEKKDDLMTVEERNDLFFSLINGKTVTEKIETSRGTFVVKFPKQKDLMLIDRLVARMRGSNPASSYDSNANFTMQKIAYLNVCVESGEEWFNKLKNKTQNVWEEVPDVDFVDELYIKAYSFRLKVQKQLELSKKSTDRENTDGQSVLPSVDGGLFEGVATTDK